jgi:hypothetical protein
MAGPPQSSDRVSSPPAGPSARRVALGAASVTVTGARLALGPPLAILRLGAGRALAPVTDALAQRGRDEEERLRNELSRTIDEAVARVLESRELDRVVAEALQNPAVERLLVRVLESALVDDLTDRVLESEELERVVRHIARSDEVRSALTQQSAGLVVEVADEVRSRAEAADATVERIARSALRRRPREAPPP